MNAYCWWKDNSIIVEAHGTFRAQDDRNRDVKYFTCTQKSREGEFHKIILG